MTNDPYLVIGSEVAGMFERSGRPPEQLHQTGYSGGSRKVEKRRPAYLLCQKFWLINYSWVTFIRISSQEDPWATWNSSASVANSVNQRRCLSCGPKKAVIYCIVTGINDIHERMHEHIMNINILVAEKGGPRPPGSHCWIRHWVSVQAEGKFYFVESKEANLL